MPAGYLFWGLMVLWLVLGFAPVRAEWSKGNYWPVGGSFLLFLLLFLVGWKVFGFVIQ